MRIFSFLNKKILERFSKNSESVDDFTIKETEQQEIDEFFTWLKSYKFNTLNELLAFMTESYNATFDVDYRRAMAASVKYNLLMSEYGFVVLNSLTETISINRQLFQKLQDNNIPIEVSEFSQESSKTVYH